MILCVAVNSVETLSDWKSLDHNPFLNGIVVSKFAYGSRILQVEVNLITYKNYTQSISHLGVRPHRHVYTTMTRQNIAYSWNIIHMSTLTHALLLVVLRPSLPPNQPTLPKPSYLDRVYLHPYRVVEILLGGTAGHEPCTVRRQWITTHPLVLGLISDDCHSANDLLRISRTIRGVILCLKQM